MQPHRHVKELGTWALAAMLAVSPMLALPYLFSSSDLSIIGLSLRAGRAVVHVAVPPASQKPVLVPAPAHVATTPAHVATPVTVSPHEAAPPGVAAGPALFRSVLDAGCASCAVTQSASGAIRVAVGGAPQGTRSAAALLDFGGAGGAGGLVAVHDRISLDPGFAPVRPVSVLQVTDVQNRVVYRLQIDSGTRRLRFVSPPGSLSRAGLNIPLDAFVPNDGAAILVEISAQANHALRVVVAGRTVLLRTALSGGAALNQRYLAVGILNSTEGTDLGVTHDDLAVTAAPTAGAVPAPVEPGKLAPAAPAVLAPSNVDPPAVAGPSVEGASLTANPGDWNGADSYRYRWERCTGALTACATVGDGPTYVLGAADVGASVRVTVTATNSGGTGVASSETTDAVVAAAPVLDTPPAVSGEAVVGSILTTTGGTWRWRNGPITFAWQRCDAVACTPISGAAGSSYTVSAADVGFTLQAVVTAPGFRTPTSTGSAPTAVVVTGAPVLVAPPTVAGNALVGSFLTVTTGAWDDPAATFAYTWQRCAVDGSNCVPILEATSDTYALTLADSGSILTVIVTATNGHGSVSAAVATGVVPQPTINNSPPTISGGAYVGSTLTASVGSWSDPQTVFAYEWLLCASDGSGCVPIAGATSDTYTAADTDLGKVLRLVVTGSSATGSTTAAVDSAVITDPPPPPPPPAPPAAPQPPVAPPAPPPPAVVTAPTVTGHAAGGSTLALDTGTWSDPQVTIAVQWQRCAADGTACVPIEGATGLTYTVTKDDLRSLLEAVVTATDAGGSTAATAAASNVVE